MKIKLIKTEIITEEFRFPVKKQFFEHPDGSIHRRDLIEHPGAVLIIPKLTSDTYVMIKQYRHAIQQEIYEFPAGTIEPGEDLVECAQRELQEEIGYKANTLKSLGHIYPTPGFCNEIIHCYLAEDLIPSQLELDDGEVIEKIILSKSEIKDLVIQNKLIDSKSLAIMTKAGLFD